MSNENRKTGYSDSRMDEYREKKGDLNVSQEIEPFWADEDNDDKYQSHCKKLLSEEKPF